MKLWIVCQNIDESPAAGPVTEFQGVFDSEEKAVTACKNEKYWIGPVELNKEIPIETTPWEGTYFPKA